MLKLTIEESEKLKLQVGNIVVTNELFARSHENGKYTMTDERGLFRITEVYGIPSKSDDFQDYDLTIEIIAHEHKEYRGRKWPVNSRYFKLK